MLKKNYYIFFTGEMRLVLSEFTSGSRKRVEVRKINPRPPGDSAVLGHSKAFVIPDAKVRLYLLLSSLIFLIVFFFFFFF